MSIKIFHEIRGPPIALPFVAAKPKLRHEANFEARVMHRRKHRKPLPHRESAPAIFTYVGFLSSGIDQHKQAVGVVGAGGAEYLVLGLGHGGITEF